MQFSLTTIAFLLAATTAMADPPSGFERRQIRQAGLGQPCQRMSSGQNNCIGELACISAGGQNICSRNRGIGQPCAQDADCNTNNCGAGGNGGQGVVAFECLE